MKSITSQLKIIQAQIHYASMLLTMAGPNIFFKQLLRQIYSRDTQVGLELNLQEAIIPRVEAKIAYSLQLASKEDMDEILQLAKTENKDMIQKLIYRRWLYEDGYHECYVARAIDTNEICFIQYIIYPEDARLTKGRFRGWLPRLKNDEVLLEGAYTFEKFRGKGLYPAVTSDQIRICKEKGYTWMLAYIAKYNTASIKGVEKAGLTLFGEAPELRILFFTRRKFNRAG